MAINNTSSENTSQHRTRTVFLPVRVWFLAWFVPGRIDNASFASWIKFTQEFLDDSAHHWVVPKNPSPTVVDRGNFDEVFFEYLP